MNRGTILSKPPRFDLTAILTVTSRHWPVSPPRARPWGTCRHYSHTEAEIRGAVQTANESYAAYLASLDAHLTRPGGWDAFVATFCKTLPGSPTY